MNGSSDGVQPSGVTDEGGEAPCFAHLFDDPTSLSDDPIELADVGLTPEPPRSPSIHEETLTEAMQRLRKVGYETDLYATDDGRLECGSCGKRYDPLSMTIDETVRFEGDSNPDDEAILLAVRCPEGCKGLYSAAFGAAVSPEDATVLRALARAPQD
ncbi:MAG: hypothetical protein QOE09_1921 [Ilumatobacteraceae bacterium]|jgi:hypothetical protein